MSLSQARRDEVDRALAEIDAEEARLRQVLGEGGEVAPAAWALLRDRRNAILNPPVSANTNTGGSRRRAVIAPVVPLQTASATAAGSAPFLARVRNLRVTGGGGALGATWFVSNASGNRIRVQTTESNSVTFAANGRWITLAVNGIEKGRMAMRDVAGDAQFTWNVANEQLAAGDRVTLSIWDSEPPAA